MPGDRRDASDRCPTPLMQETRVCYKESWHAKRIPRLLPGVSASAGSAEQRLKAVACPPATQIRAPSVTSGKHPT